MRLTAFLIIGLQFFLSVPGLMHHMLKVSAFHSLFYTVTMVMGIPTVKRKVKSYLAETLHSLIDKLSPEEKLDCVIIVFIGEVSCLPLRLRNLFILLGMWSAGWYWKKKSYLPLPQNNPCFLVTV